MSVRQNDGARFATRDASSHGTPATDGKRPLQLKNRANDENAIKEQ